MGNGAAATTDFFKGGGGSAHEQGIILIAEPNQQQIPHHQIHSIRGFIAGRCRGGTIVIIGFILTSLAILWVERVSCLSGPAARSRLGPGKHAGTTSRCDICFCLWHLYDESSLFFYSHFHFCICMMQRATSSILHCFHCHRC